MESTRTARFEGLLPAEVLALPIVEIPIDGATGFALADDEKQVVFFVFEEGVSFPDHSHCAQRGTVISGEMILEVAGRTNLYQAGDHYHVPEGVAHRTVFSKRTVLVDMSDDPQRFQIRS
ncbi:MAG: cupin domain-containing protein [Candidatus Krumholzibacteriia bacterium]